MAIEQRLQELREAIDAVDNELLTLLNRRAGLTIEVGDVKRDASDDAEFWRPDREARILQRLLKNNAGPLPDDQLVRLMREIISTCLGLEHTLEIAYLGPEGTYTHAALRKHFGAVVIAESQTDIAGIFRAVETRSCDYGVAPIENSVGGSVNETLDCLAASALGICGEIVLEVHHQLLGTVELNAVQRVYAHAQAFQQCRSWLRENLPGAELIAQASNAAAARRARDEDGAAAIASAEAGALYELPVLAANIEDNAHNTTRFIVIGRNVPAPTGADRTTVMFSMPNEAGALHGVLGVLADRNISMSRIESRPLRNGQWDYLFFVDLLGHAQDAAVAEALAEIERRAALFKVLGSCPRAIG